MTTPFSSMMWVVTGAFIGSMGAAGLKAGAKRLSRDGLIVSAITNWRLALGILAYVISSVFFVFGLRKGELSVLYPLVSLGYLFTLLWSRLFFAEPFTRFKFVGVGLILAALWGLISTAWWMLPLGCLCWFVVHRPGREAMESWASFQRSLETIQDADALLKGDLTPEQTKAIKKRLGLP